LSFVAEDHTLYFNETDYAHEGTNYEEMYYPDGILVDKSGGPGDNTGVTVTVNPKIGGQYAEITLHDLEPGKIAVFVQPKVWLELDVANVNLDTFVKAAYTTPGENPLEGSFPSDEGLNLASVFDGMGSMGQNINFDQLDLYLYMDGNREKLEGTAFTLTARSPELGEGVLLTESGGTQFENLDPDQNPPNFNSVTDGVFSGALENAQFHTDKLLDVINGRPSELRIEYDITLTDHLVITGKDLMVITGEDLKGTPEDLKGTTISFQPALILVMPLRLRLLSGDDAGYGSLQFTDIEPEDDIFGRAGPDDEINDYLKQLKRVAVRVDYDNTVGLDKTSVLLVSRGYDDEPNWESEQLITFSEGAGNTLTLELYAEDFLVYPLRPSVEIRTPADATAGDGRKYGLIEIKRGVDGKAGIRAAVSVEVESHLDMEFGF
jgi:hypothetical protein